MSKEQKLLNKITTTDELIHTNQVELIKCYNSYEQRYLLYKKVEHLYNMKYKFIILLLMLLCTLMIMSKPLIAMLSTFIIWLLLNFLVINIKRILKPKYQSYEQYNKYVKEYNALILERSSYINMYKYLMTGEQTIIQNIKLRMNSDGYYDYALCYNEKWLHNDEELLNIFNEMWQKEKNFIAEIISNLEENRQSYQADKVETWLHNLKTV